MQDPFRRVQQTADPFRRMAPQQRDDIAPVQQTYLPWKEAAYRFVSNIPRSALENVRDAAMLVRPVGKASHGESTAMIGDWTVLPGLQDLGALVGQAGIAGVEKATGAEIMSEKRVLEGLIDFYEANYGLGPEGMKGFERFLTEDPVGFLTDLMMFASVGSAAPSIAARTGTRAGATAKAFRGLRGSSKPASVGEAFTRAWKEGKQAVAYENYAPFVVRVDHVLNRGFAVPSKLQGLFRNIPVVRKRLTDVPVSFGKRAGTTDTGFRMGLAEVADPAAHVLRGTLGRVGRGLGTTLQRREPAASAAERQGVELPLSAKAVSPAAAAAEASRLKADDPEVHARVMGVYESLDRIAEETVNKISDASDPDVAANLAVEGYEAYTAAFKAEMEKLYDSIEDLGRVPAVLTHTKAFFDQFARDAAQGEPLTGRQEFSPLLHSIRENVEAYAEQYPERVGPDGRPVSGDGGGTPPAASGAGDSSGDVAVRRAHRSGTSRMLKGNWGHKYQAEYAVVELDDLIASHLPDGTENPAFDPNLQPRDRGDASSQLQVEDIARNLDPDLLLDDTSSMNDGAPIIGDDMMVESGNGRVMAMKLAASNPVYAARMDVYKRQLLADLGRYGLTADDVGAMRMPVLVRRRLTDVDRSEFVKEANEASGKSFRSAESAVQDARFMDADLMQQFSFGDETTLRAALQAGRNNAFVNGFIAKFPNDKQGAFFDASGRRLTDEGYARIERAMLLSVFDNTFGAVMAGRFADVSDAGMVNVKKAVYAALPEMAQLKYLIEAGDRRPELGFFEDVAQAVLKVRELSEAGESASFARRQGRMFTGAEWGEMYDDLSDDAARILLMVERGKEAPSELTEFLKWYARQVDAQGSVQQGTLFDEGVAPVTKAEILQTALGREFEDVPDISELRAAFRGDAPVDQAPPPPVRNQPTESQQSWLRAVFGNAYEHNLERFTDYFRKAFDTDAQATAKMSGFEDADKLADWIRKNAVTPEQVETRIEELRIAVRTGEPVSLKGKEFESYRELAVLSQALRDASVEWMHVFYVRKDGDVHNIVGHETTTLNSGNVTRTRGYKALHAQMEELQADGLVFLHNHPGAVAAFSAGDQTNHTTKANFFGEAYLGDLVINSGTYAYYLKDTDGAWLESENVELSADELGWDPRWGSFQRNVIEMDSDPQVEMWHPHIRTNDPLFTEEGRLAERWMAGEGFNYSVNTVQDIIKNLGWFGRQLKIDNNWVVLNMASSWDRLNAVVQVRGDQLAAMPLQQRAQFLRELALKYGGDQVHVFVGKGDWYGNREQAWEAFSDVNKESAGGGIMSVMVHGQKSGWVNRETDFYERAWKAGPREDVMLDKAPEPPGRTRRGLEHMARNEESFNKIMEEGFIKPLPQRQGTSTEGQVWFSSGADFRAAGHNWGFIFDPDVINEKYGAERVEHSREWIAKGSVDIKDAVGVVQNGAIRMITEDTRGFDPSQWAYRDVQDAGKLETLSIFPIRGDAFDVDVLSAKPEPPGRTPRGLGETRTERLPELLWENVKRTRTIVGDALFSKNPDPIVSREERFYKQLYDALTADLSEAVARHAPERVGEFEEISRRYAEGRGKINEGWGLKILRSAQKGEQEKLVRAIFKPDMPVEQIPLVYELFGGKESEGGRAMQSAFIRELLKRSKSADGAWLPASLRRQLNNHGDKRLRAFFDDEAVSALNDLADISLGMADFAKMAHGSQTAFLAREMLEGSMMGGALQKLAWRIGTGPVGWLLMFGDIVGQQAATRFFTSPEGEAFLMRGGVRTAVGEGMEWLTRGAQGQLVRGANRAIEGEVR